MCSSPGVADRVGEGEGEVLVANAGLKKRAFVGGGRPSPERAGELPLGLVAGWRDEVSPSVWRRLGFEVVSECGMGDSARESHGGKGGVLPETSAVAHMERPGSANVDNQRSLRLVLSVDDPVMEIDQCCRRDLLSQPDGVDDDVDACECFSHTGGVIDVDGPRIVGVLRYRQWSRGVSGSNSRMQKYTRGAMVQQETAGAASSPQE